MVFNRSSMKVLLRIAATAYFMAIGTFSASAGNLQFRHITEKQGLKHTWIQHITKDSKGYMWFSTIYGAYRYDGFGFEEYEFPVEDGGEVAGVNVVYETSDGMILFGTNDGIWSHNPAKGEYSHSFGGDSPFSGSRVEDIIEDKYGNLFIASSRGLSRMASDGSLKTWKIGHVRTLMIDTRETVWAGTFSGEIFRLDSLDDQFVPADMPIDNSHPINDLFQSSSYDIYISTTGGGLFRYKLPQRVVEHYSASRGTLPNDIVRSVVEDDNGAIYAATERGLVRIKDSSAEFITSEKDNIWSLNDNAVHSLYCDEDNNLWVGTFFGGVNVTYHHFDMFDFLLSGSEEYSADSKVVSSIVRAGSKLYIGTENDGIYILNDDGNTSRLATFNSNITSDNIHSICVDSRNNLWVGTYYGGLFMKGPGSNEFRRFVADGSPRNPLTTNNIYTVFQDSRGNLWVGTQYGGLYRYDYSRGRLERFGHESLNHSFVWDIHEDRAGDIWIACYGGGIWRLSSAENHSPLKIETPARNFVTLCELRDGRILAGTEKEGLVAINPLTLEVEWINKSKGLPDNTVYGILQDDNDNIWLSTNTGLYRADASMTSFANYTIADGLPTNRFNYNACAKLDGKLYFGSINGVVIVDTGRQAEICLDRPIRFNNLYINNVRQTISSEGVLNTDLNEIKELKLKYWQNSFGIEFSPNIFGYTAGLSFAYKMSGTDGNWHEIGSKHRVDFTELKPGRYTFMVAGVDDGVVLDNVSTLKIRITPVWWQSLLTKICFSLLVLIIIIWLTRIFLQVSKHKHALELEKLAREKDKEINEMKFRFFVNISHEFKTPLSLILGPVEQFMHGRVPKEMTQKYFSIIQKNADKLLGLINELLAFREVQFAALKVSSVNISSLVKVVLSRHEWLFENKKITLGVDVPEELVVEADQSKLEKIFDNLLSNAYKHTDIGGKVDIRASVAGETVCIVIEDNGAGIPEHKLPYIFERFFTGRSYDMYSSGVGLSYVRSLVELHGGSISAESEFGRFTKIQVLLPLKSRTDNTAASEENEYKKVEGSIRKPETFAADADYDKEEYAKFAAETAVLIVEDDHSMRELLMDHFGRKYMVMSAESGEVAAKIIHENKVDVVITDVMLSGGMSGFELCHYIKNSVETSHIKVILMTVLSEQDYKYQGYNAGADAYLTKPFSFSILELQLRNLLMNAYKMRESYKIEIDMSNVKIKASNTDEQLIKRVVEIIFEHLGESEFSVDDLCLNIGMSKATLYRKLKSLTGQSTNEFMQNTRLKYAARLLSETEKTISEVAYEVGFSDPYYFSRAFKKIFGKSPKQWREKSGNDSANN
ncbi:MAG: response regulator [Bacteroidales bacterium]|nr:response regulator [Bacteroidales bacterium]